MLWTENKTRKKKRYFKGLAKCAVCCLLKIYSSSHFQNPFQVSNFKQKKSYSRISIKLSFILFLGWEKDFVFLFVLHEQIEPSVETNLLLQMQTEKVEHDFNFSVRQKDLNLLARHTMYVFLSFTFFFKKILFFVQENHVFTNAFFSPIKL